MIGWCVSVCGQTKEKKVAAVSIATTIMISSLMWTRYSCKAADETRYKPALASSAGFSMAAAVCAWVAKIVMVRRNRVLRQSGDETTNFCGH
jgi:hypothetical protein